MVVDVADKYKNNPQNETEIESDSLEFKNLSFPQNFVEQIISMKKFLHVLIFKTSIINS